MSSLSKVRPIVSLKQTPSLTETLENLEDGQQDIDEIRKSWKLRLEKEQPEGSDNIKAPKGQEDEKSHLMQCFHAEQDGDAQLYVECNWGCYCLDAKTGEYNEYIGPYWRKDFRNDSLAAGTDKVVQKYIELAELLNADGSSRNEKLIKRIIRRIKRLQTLAYKKSVREQASYGKGGLSIRGDEWDRDPYLLCCENGVVEIRTGECVEGRADQYLRKTTGLNFDKNTGPPVVWLRYLSECLRYTKPQPKPADYQLTDEPDLYTQEGKDQFETDLKKWEETGKIYTDVMIAFLQRLLGYSILGEVREHIFVVLYGRGRNGKSVLAEILNHVLGDYAGAIQPEMLLSSGYGKSSSSPSPDMMALVGIRVAIAQETNDGCRLDSSIIKRYVGADELVGRSPYDREVTRFQPTFTLFLVTNNLPAIPADDYALLERIVPIHFGVSFVDDPDPNDPTQGKIDKDLLKKLKKEAPAILNWLVEGYMTYAREGLNIPSFIKETAQQYQRDNDILGFFFEDACEVTDGITVSGRYLYACYEAWCRHNGHKTYSHTKFGQKMKLRFDSYRDKNGIRYRGITSTYLEENPPEDYRG